jgi:D-cysteine desulfhydrase family pyridoxal phosphate-dependent enzyme
MVLGTIPRVRLATLPTLLQDAPRLRDALGGPAVCPRIVIKRDDLTGLAFGGNKVRKLEFLVADALAAGATTLVTAGAAHSNHARLTAAAARVAGLRAVLVLDSANPNPPVQGNLLLDRLLDAEVRIIPHGADKQVAMREVGEELTARGERPYLITVGGSNAIGALGYVAATLELLGQCFELGIAPSRLYYANGSHGTQVGLVLGAKLFNAPYLVQGISDSAIGPEQIARAVGFANETAARLNAAFEIAAADLISDDGYYGAGYGAMTAGCAEAIALVARSEAVFLDPVYSGKAMAGLIDHIRDGRIDPAETVLFLHTGGTPGLFSRADDVMAELAR